LRFYRFQKSPKFTELGTLLIPLVTKLGEDNGKIISNVMQQCQPLYDEISALLGKKHNNSKQKGFTFFTEKALCPLDLGLLMLEQIEFKIQSYETWRKFWDGLATWQVLVPYLGSQQWHKLPLDYAEAVIASFVSCFLFLLLCNVG